MGSSAFDIAYDNTMRHEGFYANLKGDKGGETYMGIARNFYPSWPGWSYVDRAKRNNGGSLPNNYRINEPVLDAYVKAFFRSEKWNKFQLDRINNINLAKLIFDFVVHSRYAVREIQKALRSLGYGVSVDNIMGQNTISAINSADPAMLYDRIKQQRINYLKSLNQPKFLPGWIARVSRFNDYGAPGISIGLIAVLAGAGIYGYQKMKRK